MSDLIKAVLAAVGAVAGAAAILSGLLKAGAIITAFSAGAVTLMVAGVPTVICLGGVAYAASRFK